MGGGKQRADLAGRVVLGEEAGDARRLLWQRKVYRADVAARQLPHLTRSFALLHVELGDDTQGDVRNDGRLLWWVKNGA